MLHVNLDTLPVNSIHSDWKPKIGLSIQSDAVREQILNNDYVSRKISRRLFSSFNLVPINFDQLQEEDAHALSKLFQDPKSFIEKAGLIGHANYLAGLINRDDLAPLLEFYDPQSLRMAIRNRNLGSADSNGNYEIERFREAVKDLGSRIVFAWSLHLHESVGERVSLLFSKTFRDVNQLRSNEFGNADKIVHTIAGYDIETEMASSLEAVKP